VPETRIQTITTLLYVNAISGIEIKSLTEIEVKFPNQAPEKYQLGNERNYHRFYENFLIVLFGKSEHPLANLAQGLYGYTSYDAVQFFFDTAKFKPASPETDIPLTRYRLYQYVIAINHFNDEMTIFENKIKGLESDFSTLETFINQKTAPVFPFE
jgi:anthranilate synthase component 1